MRRFVPVCLCSLCCIVPATAGGAKNDQGFLAKLIADQMAEIKMAETARDNAASADVKNYAKHLIDDHTKLRNLLLDKARIMKISVVQELEKDYKAKIDRLAKLRGADLDREYIKMIIDDHQKELSELPGKLKTLQDQELRTMITNALPTMREHLKMAQKIAQDLK